MALILGGQNPVYSAAEGKKCLLPGENRQFYLASGIYFIQLSGQGADVTQEPQIEEQGNQAYGAGQYK